jgi:hypothetical protein
MLALACPLFCVDHASAADAAPSLKPAESGPITTGLRVFTCGHSFHLHIPPLLAEIAATAGIQGHTSVGVSGIGGSPAYRHWDVPDDKNKAKAALIAGDVDVLTLSCMSEPDRGIEQFAQLAFAHNPNVRVTVQEIWLPQDTWPFEYSKHLYKSPEDFNTADLNEVKKKYAAYTKVMEDYVTGVNTKLGKQVVFLVPDGAAEIALREKIVAGQAPTLKKQSELFGDWWGHPALPLRILTAYCHYAVIYRRSPVGLPMPPSASGRKMDKDLILLMQQLAWDAVIHDPFSGVTEAAASAKTYQTKVSPAPSTP